MQAQIDAASTMVETFREDTKAFFPYPTLQECLEFTLTELSESLEAMLRSKPEFKRNNARNVDIQHELVDVLFMMTSSYNRLTVYLPDDLDWIGTTEIREEHFKAEIIEMMENVAKSWFHVNLGLQQTQKWHFDDAMAYLKGNLVVLFAMLGDNWQQLLQERLNALANKHGGSDG